jgi:trehalose-phosphatase
MQKLRDSVSELTDIVADFPGTSLEDKHFSLSLHFRAMNAALLPVLEARVEEVADRFALRISPGKRVFNVMPARSATKGDAVREIIAAAAGNTPSASIFFVGDDVTDEDAFRELTSFPNAVTARVGDYDDVGESAAQLWVDDPHAVHELLSLLAEART